MKRRRLITAIAGVMAAIFLFILFFCLHDDSSFQRRLVERRVERRLGILDSYVSKALEAGPSEWVNLQSLPEDMVIYRYHGDTLNSWTHQFSIENDDIADVTLVERMVSPRAGMVSKLQGLRQDISFCNFGPKWYLAKAVPSEDGVRVIAGLEILDSHDLKSANNANPLLRIPSKFAVRPLDYTGGYEVSVGGAPLFKLIEESLTPRGIGGNLLVFSPTLFAGGPVLKSLGWVFIFNFLILAASVLLFLFRKRLFAAVIRKKKMILLSVLDLVCVAGIMVYLACEMRNVALNSSICLELTKFKDLTIYSLMVYLSFLTMLVSVPLLLSLLTPVCVKLFGFRPDFLSFKPRLFFGILVASLIVIMNSSLGIEKEQRRLSVWADRIVFDRQLRLELQLRRVEAQIADDLLIATLSVLDNSDVTIRNRIIDNYFSRESQDYDISVLNVKTLEDMKYSSDVFIGGEQIMEHSRFCYVPSSSGRPRYVALFMYYVMGNGVSRVLIEIEPRTNIRQDGYARILGLTSPGKVSVPSEYSYARYTHEDLALFKGEFAYPTRLSGSVFQRGKVGSSRFLDSGGFIHFVSFVSEDDTVVFSRKKAASFNLVVEIVLIASALFLLLSIFVIGRRKKEVFTRNYFKQRIMVVVTAAVTVTLVTMAVLSVLFVYHRNEDNRLRVMTDKINSIQSLISGRLRGVHSSEDFRSPEVSSLLDMVSVDTDTDLTLYSPDGVILTSTFPLAYEFLYLNRRMDENAYNGIVNNSKLYYVQKENYGTGSYYDMYAPIRGENGKMEAIVCAPYSGDDLDFEQEAIRHTVSILALFVVLFLMAILIMERLIDKLFSPLRTLSRKMENADLNTLEHIRYDREDEITGLVRSYNQMVDDLSESTARLAQAERDKAWSGMARQVAHEIKNPLTPMKLQLQRLIRLKDKNDPSWAERFDDVSRLLLDHIDILSDTANEFSTFAKLYTEEPAIIDLDMLLQEEIAMFDARDGITIDYFGLSLAMVEAPKPQLARVFVNIINNAVQAVESAKGSGRILVSLRNSAKEGHFDIVFEDDGPGVPEENRSKLFTPNFTTKNGGSGLGLAISRSILERCDASLSYSRSFSLGGACFTITYPKLNNSL